MSGMGKGKGKESDPTDASADSRPTRWPPFILPTYKMRRWCVGDFVRALFM